MAQAYAELRAGRPIIVVDDFDRENEGDFIVAARGITPDVVNLLAARGRGLICVALTEQRARELDLPLQVPEDENKALLGTRFTVTVDAIEGTTTGISAYDRARTIDLLADESACPEDFARPGHVFPIIAVDGGLERRRGHTEATVALMRLAGLPPVGVLCEIMADDGSMARLPELERIGEELGIMLLSVEEIAALETRD